MWTVAKAALLYFGCVFGAGFVLGAIRAVWVAPRLGKRPAELMESPLMLAVTILAARWIVARRDVPASAPAHLAVGGIALGLMLAAEFGLMLRVRRISLQEYFAERDPVSGTVYYVLLVVFALMPLLIGAK